MITSVLIENYRCIRHAEFTLEPLTVFVGPNGSGKTTILDALDRERTLQRAAPWRQDPSLTPVVRTEQGEFVVGRQDGRKYRSMSLQLEPAKLRDANRLENASKLSVTGDNLANVFGSLTRRQQEQVSKRLRALVPVVGDVDLQPTANGFHRLRFQDRWREDLWYGPDDVSDGTMLLVAFLLLEYQPVDLLCIEDPEHALHPFLLEELVGMLRKLARGELGRSIQVVAATHSAEFLQFFEPQEVRFLSRRAETGEVLVRTVDPKAPDWEQSFREYRGSLSEAWLSGGLGGV